LSSSWGPVRRNRSRPYLPLLGLRYRRPDPILAEYRAPSLPEDGHDG
jgi:hypothetical protein